MQDFTITHVGGVELTLPMPFKFIPAKGKKFMFQADDGTEYGTKYEGIPITFENDFWMCAYQTTQEFWAEVVRAINSKVLDPNPSNFKGKTRPTEQVTWDEVQFFNNALNNLLQEDKLTFEDNYKPLGVFDLPSESQWEYAACAEQNTVFAGSDCLEDVGWYVRNSNGQTMPVGLKQANEFGLYDVSGNVLEWCADDYIEKLSETPKDGRLNLKKGQTKVIRGGSIFDNAEYCRLRYRFHERPLLHLSDIGFRLCFRLVQPFTKTNMPPKERRQTV